LRVNTRQTMNGLVAVPMRTIALIESKLDDMISMLSTEHTTIANQLNRKSKEYRLDAYMEQFCQRRLSSIQQLAVQCKQDILAMLKQTDNNSNEPQPPPPPIPIDHKSDELKTQHIDVVDEHKLHQLPLPLTPIHHQSHIQPTSSQHKQRNSELSNTHIASPSLSPICGRYTQVILDWDNTLFPTSYTLVNINKGLKDSRDLQQRDWSQLHDLMQCVCQTLKLFIHCFGAENVAIVTNAKLEWFRESCRLYKFLYLPVQCLVDTYQIRVVSAHDTCSRQKSIAFRAILSEKTHIRRVICIGDSNEEYDAVDTVCQVLRILSRRSISYYRFKLVQHPSVTAMGKQLKYIQKRDLADIAKRRADESFHFK